MTEKLLHPFSSKRNQTAEATWADIAAVVTVEPAFSRLSKTYCLRGVFMA